VSFLICHYQSANDAERVRQLALLGARHEDAPTHIVAALEAEVPDVPQRPAKRARTRNGRAPKSPAADGVHTVTASSPAALQLQLPPQFTRFFGREAEIAQVREIFGSESTRLLTLTGAGGAGKTRLAIEVARRLYEEAQNLSPLSVCFVPLANVRDPAQIGTLIIHALQLPRVEGEVLSGPTTARAFPGERLVAALQRHDSLLIFDNFEHLTEAASFLELLLIRVPRLKILVTSQHRLHVAGERELPISPLPIPCGDDFEAIAAAPSVQLFVDRAQQARPDFQITPHNAADISGVCIELEGAPLALELAAARIGVLTPRQIALQLAAMRTDEAGRLDFLHQPRRAATPRHQSLRTAITWSYNLLPPDVARFWTSLAVFRGAFTAEAAACITDQSGVHHLLGQLRAYSLIGTEEGESEMRFRWSGMLHEFAAELLNQQPENALVRRRHAEYYCDLFADAVMRLRTPDESHALRWAILESDNARSALEWAQQQNEYPLCMALALSLGIMLQRHGLHREALECFETGRNAMEQLPDTYDAQRVELLRESAGVALDLMQWEHAREHSTALQRLCRKRGDDKGLAAAVNLLGLAAKNVRQWKRARTYFARALDGFEKQGDTIGAANARNNLGLIEYLDERGDRAVAQAQFEETLRLRRELNDARGVAETYINLGALAQQRSDLDDAERYYRAALVIELRLQHLFGVGRALCNLGEIAEERTQLAEACRLFIAAQSLFETSGAAYRTYSAERAARLAAHVRVPDELKKNADRLAQAGEMESLVEWVGIKL
jgi:predicted ATPase/Tfp pilus assembly protein PilF